MKTRSRNRVPYRSHDREICGSWSLEEILYEFAGGPHIITLDRIERAVSRFPDSAPAEEVVDALIEGMFCGMEIAPGEFAYLCNETDRLKLQSMSRRVCFSSRMSVRPIASKIFRACITWSAVACLPAAMAVIPFLIKHGVFGIVLMTGTGLSMIVSMNRVVTFAATEITM